MRMVYKAHAGALLGTLLRWTCGDRPAAEDLLQETMLRAWRNLDTLNPDTAALRSWLMTVARRIAIDALRARTARPPETAADPLERVAVSGEPFEQYVNRQVIRDALAGLSAEHRAALTHVYFLDQTVPQAARQLGVPEGTVKSRLHYALRAVRAAIEAVGLGRGLSTVDA
jgi:RNA polymerase sigma-70 factor (ECF subfamily)